MNSVKCTKCGLVAFATTAECKRCGTPYGAAAAANAYAPPSGGGYTSSFGGGYAPPSGHAQAAQGVAGYYKPSGEITVAGLAAGLAGGAVAGLAIGFVYSYLIAYIPFVYLNFLCTVGYAFGLASAAGYLMRAGKMRNPAVGCFVGAAVGLVSYYFSWAVWLSIAVSGSKFSVSALELAARPDALWSLLLLVNEKGAWGVGRGLSGGATVSGVLLWAVWAVEAVIVLGGTTFGAWAMLTMDPFCESCQTWCKEEKSVLSVRPAETGELKRRFEAKDFAFMKALGLKGEGDAAWLRLDLHRCPHCGKTNTLTVLQETVKGVKNGKPDVETKSLFDKLLLTDNDIYNLRRVGSEMSQPQPVSAV